MSDPRGKIVVAVSNVDGSWHEGKACRKGGIYRRLENDLPDEYCIIADRAYHGGVAVNNKIVRILKSSELLPPGMTAMELCNREHLIIRARQPGEWINEDLVSYMRHLRCVLSTDDVYNGNIMEIAKLIHNFRVEHRDRNQMKHFFKNLELEDNNEEHGA